MLAPKSRSALRISVCPIVQAKVEQPESLYLIGIGPDNSSLMLVVRKIFFGTFIFSFLGHMSLRIWHMKGFLNCIKRFLLD